MVINQDASGSDKKFFIRMLFIVKNSDAIKITRVHTLKVSLFKRGAHQKSKKLLSYDKSFVAWGGHDPPTSAL
jgi:hypothetical protein